MTETPLPTSRSQCAACDHALDDVCGLDRFGSLRMVQVLHSGGGSCRLVAHEGCVRVLRDEAQQPPDSRVHETQCPCGGGLIVDGVDVPESTPAVAASTSASDYWDGRTTFDSSEDEEEQSADSNETESETESEEEEEDSSDAESEHDDEDEARTQRTLRDDVTDGSHAISSSGPTWGEDDPSETIGRLRDDDSFTAQTWRSPDEAPAGDDAD